MDPAPIVLFTYNRPTHTRKTIEALKENKWADQSTLIIFSDGPRDETDRQKIETLRSSLRKTEGFRAVRLIERNTNLGLGNNIIDGVSQVLNEFGKVIVLEDDLLTSPYFLQYMNEALVRYKDEENVISIHGYCYPVDVKLPETYFIRGADCLGWGTWKRGWSLFEADGRRLLAALEQSKQESLFNFEDTYPYTQMLRDQIQGKNNSWAIRWYASAFLQNKLTLYPGRSLIFHMGGDGSGTNTGFDQSLSVPLSRAPVKVADIRIIQNQDAYHAFAGYFRKAGNPTVLYRLKRKFKRWLAQRRNSND